MSSFLSLWAHQYLYTLYRLKNIKQKLIFYSTQKQCKNSDFGHLQINCIRYGDGHVLLMFVFHLSCNNRTELLHGMQNPKRFLPCHERFAGSFSKQWLPLKHKTRSIWNTQEILSPINKIKTNSGSLSPANLWGITTDRRTWAEGPLGRTQQNRMWEGPWGDFLFSDKSIF